MFWFNDWPFRPQIIVVPNGYTLVEDKKHKEQRLKGIVEDRKNLISELQKELDEAKKELDSLE